MLVKKARELHAEVVGSASGSSSSGGGGESSQ